MDNYKISIVIPVYNSERFLKNCLDSIVNQSYKNLEIIAVNDASPDNSLDILYEYEKKYSNFKVINLLKNKRQGGARNEGIKQATGEYITFVDSDDWIELDRFENVAKVLEKKEVDVILCDYYYREYVNGQSELLNDNKADFLKTIKGKILNIDEKNQLVFKGTGIWQNVYKTSVIKNNEIFFPEGLSYEDNYFVPLYYMYVNSIEYIDKPFYHYRENLSSTMHRNDNTQLDRLRILKLFLQTIEERGLKEDFGKSAEIIVIRTCFNTLSFLYVFFKDRFCEITKSMTKYIHSEYPNFKKNIYYKCSFSLKERIKILLTEISPLLIYFLFKLKK